MDSSDFEFFAILLQPPLGKLRLAEKFGKWLEGREPREVKLREAGDVSGRLWDVEVLFDRVGQLYLGHGWNQFAKYYNLEEGHLLVFSYDCNNVLTVKVFGPTMCRMYYQHDNAIPDSVLDQFCVFSKGANLNESQKTVLKNFCAQNQPKPPLYICSIVKSHIVDGKGQMVNTWNM